MNDTLDKVRRELVAKEVDEGKKKTNQGNKIPPTCQRGKDD